MKIIPILLPLLLLSAPAFAQAGFTSMGGEVVNKAQKVAVYGKNGSGIHSAGNPVAVELQGSSAITGTVGVKGADGTNISGAANPVAAELYTGGSTLSATNPLFAAPSGVAQASFTNLTDSVPSGSTTVNLVAASRHVVIKTDPAAAVMYVDLANGTATSADFRIDPGASFTYEGGTAISAFKIIGASATGTYSVAAW